MGHRTRVRFVGWLCLLTSIVLNGLVLVTDIGWFNTIPIPLIIIGAILLERSARTI